jgi:hypothetical protein
MDAPQEIEQVADASASTEKLLAAEFDRLESEDTDNGEIQAEEGEAQTETVEAVQPETEVEEQAEEVTAAEVAEDVVSAEESGYKEPPPERWPDSLKDHYNQLDPAAKKLIMDEVYKPMQRKYTQSTQELAEMRKTVEPMLKSMNQYQNQFERMGVNPQEAFTTQMAWAAHFADVGPEQGVSDMRDAYGLNKGDAGEQTAEQYLTPTERRMQGEIEGLKKQVSETSDQTNNWQEQQRTEQQQAQYKGVQTELTSFINEQKDGKPLHPHVEKVAPAIAGIIRGGLISTTDEYGQPVPIKAQMAQAYDMACRLDPSISTATSSVRQVNSAKNALNADVVANTPAGQVEVPKLTVMEELEANYDKLAGRVG